MFASLIDIIEAIMNAMMAWDTLMELKEAICPLARIMIVADAFDAITKPTASIVIKKTVEEALYEIQS